MTTAEWNAHQDAGRPWVDAVEILAAEHPEQRELIEAFHRRWPEMLVGEIPGTVDVLADLRAAGVRLLALSNWSTEMFPVARERFEFLAWFEGIVISGDVGVNKPDRRIYEQLVEQFGLEPTGGLHRRLAGERRRCKASRVPCDAIHRRGRATTRARAARAPIGSPGRKAVPRDLSAASRTRAPGRLLRPDAVPAANAEAIGASGSVSVSGYSSRARSRRSRSSCSWVSVVGRR